MSRRLFACMKHRKPVQPCAGQGSGYQMMGHAECRRQLRLGSKESPLTIVSDAITIVNGIAGSSCPVEIELVVQYCIFICNDFLHISVVFVKRALNVEAHRMVTLAKLDLKPDIWGNPQPVKKNMCLPSQ
ncbi:hypothetical protein L195_g032743 [Trifolium pratense]|uniref:RNase H type-1 domain-containing protein n=1 Tax=Trifolium pratense TaxID=57577 RepID=A0A2K3LE57_TRIPR|nr:hypothetical protein L195_g032743 [Trifolium pratense]